MRDQSCEAIINHFSHEHPLHLTNPQPFRTCSACSNQTLITEPLYTCKSTSCTTFSLHLNCTKLPPTITHPCHHNHPLLLVPKSHNTSSGFICNACGNHGDGFAYSCKDCGINIHTACAKLPLSLSHTSHFHQLGLVFSSPYPTNGFSCDVCGVIEGSKCWFYRCGTCGFDAHLSCAKSKVQVVNQAANNLNLFMNNMNQINDQRNQFLQRLMSGGAGNMNNVQIQQAINGGRGGGSSINDQILQAIMGGGGGSNQLLQSFMGGGGGSNQLQLLQSFMGGGGGGGGDLIQGLLNGSSSNGGLDLSSVLGNVGDLGGMMGGFGGVGFF